MVSATHPTDPILAAHGRGDSADPESVALHLEACPDCRRRMIELRWAETATGAPDTATAPDRACAPGPPPAGLSGVTAAPKCPASKVPAASGPIPAAIAALPGYAEIRELGKGGMGVVYLAKNKLMDRWEVLKVLGQQLLDKPDAADRFLREIRSAAMLQHSNVVGAYSAFQVGESLYFAME